ncbi:MAG: helix-turn-helix domain-containing protein [Acidimicrobiales bacterium]
MTNPTAAPKERQALGGRPLNRRGLKITNMYYAVSVISGDLIKEARHRAGLTQAQLAQRLGKSQSAIARWERDDVQPSLEMLRDTIRGCGFDLLFFMSVADDSNVTIIDEHLRMTTEERFADMMSRVRFAEQRQLRDGGR